MQDFFGRFLVALHLEFAGPGVCGGLVVGGVKSLHPGVLFLQSANRAFDFVSLFEAACGDLLLQGPEVCEEAFLGS